MAIDRPLTQFRDKLASLEVFDPMNGFTISTVRMIMRV